MSATQQLLHETIRKVTADIEALRFNTAIAQMMIFANHLQKVDMVTLATAKAFLQLLAPFAPHCVEAIWARLGEPPSIAHAPWPQAQADAGEPGKVTIVYQVNGKRRGQGHFPEDADQAEVLAAAKHIPRVAAQLSDKTVRKVIYVPGKILNIVAG